MNKRALCSILLLGSTIPASHAQLAVAEAGPQLQMIQKIQVDMDSLNKLETSNIQPDIHQLRLNSDGSKKLALLMAQQIELDKYNQILVQGPNGTTTAVSATGLSYNPSNGSFSGGNQSFIDNIVGARGLPIGLDHDVPSVLVPLTAPQSTALTSLKNSLTSTMPTSGLGNLFFSGASSLAGPMQSMISSASSAASQSMVADGVFIRPYAGQTDDMYNTLASSSNPTSVLTYYANAGSSYQPILGANAGSAGQLISGNLNNILSNNQYNAVATALAATGGSNPYANFGTSMSSVAASALGSTQLGQPLSLTASQVTAQGGAGAQAPLSAGSIPSLFASQSGTTGSTPAAGSMVAVSTLNQDQASQYSTALQNSDTQIQANWTSSQKAQTLLTYANSQITELTTIAGQVQSLRKQMAGGDATQPIPQVTQLLSQLQAEIAARQQFAAQLQMRIDDLGEKRANLLQSREQARQPFVMGVGLTGSQNVHNAISSGQNVTANAASTTTPSQ